MAMFDGNWCIGRMRALVNDAAAETFTDGQALELFNFHYRDFVAKLGDHITTAIVGPFSGQSVTWTAAGAGNIRFWEIGSNHPGPLTPLDQRSYNEVVWLQRTEGATNNNVRLVGWEIYDWISGGPAYRFVVYPIPIVSQSLILYVMGMEFGEVNPTTYPIYVQPHEVDIVIRLAAADMAHNLDRPQTFIDEILRPTKDAKLNIGIRHAWRYDWKSKIPDDQTMVVGPIGLPSG